MKYSLLLFTMLLFVFKTNAQVKLDDFGRIVLNTYLPDEIDLTDEARKLLSNKLNQVTSNNGIGGNQVNPRFIITAAVNVGSKDIIGGPPQMIAQNIDVTLYIGDAITNTMYSNVTLSLKGVGTNENKAFIESFKGINSNNKEVIEFLEAGKNKIINYYSTNCDFIIKDAQTLVNQEKYDEAIYQLSLVPDADCKRKFNDAKASWAATQNHTGAEKAGDILSTINPLASCQPEINDFIKSVEAKLKADEKERWLFKMKQYADKIAMEKEQVRIAEEKSKRDDTYREIQSQRNSELDEIRINSYREVAIEHAKNQPKSVTYNNIYWR